MPHYFKNKKIKYSIDENYIVNASDEILNTSIDNLKLHPKTFEILKNNNILNIKAMAIRSERDYFRIQGFNKKSLMDIERTLKNYNLNIKPHDNENIQNNSNSINNSDIKEKTPTVHSVNKEKIKDNLKTEIISKSFKDILNTSLQLNANKDDNRNSNKFEKNFQNKDYLQNTNKKEIKNSNDNTKFNLKITDKNEKWNFKDDKKGTVNPKEDYRNFNHKDKSNIDNRIFHKDDNRLNNKEDNSRKVNRNKQQAEPLKNENELKKFLINGKYGYKNCNNQVVIPAIYDEIFAFKEDLACVEVKELYGYIDINNNIVIPYDKFELATSFSEGLAAVMYKGKYGYIDKSGQFIIQPQFDAATTFEEGVAKVKQDGKWATLFTDGTIKPFK